MLCERAPHRKPPARGTSPVRLAPSSPRNHRVTPGTSRQSVYHRASRPRHRFRVRRLTFTMRDILAELAATLEDRKGSSPDSSYVASLYASGLDRILKKVGEEAAETIIAAKGGNDAALVHEVADLWFHTLVLLAERGLHPRQVLAELERRAGVSGHEEKASRGSTGARDT